MKKILKISILGIITLFTLVSGSNINALTNEISTKPTINEDGLLIEPIYDDEVITNLSSEDNEISTNEVIEDVKTGRAATNITISQDSNYKIANADGTVWAFWINATDSRGLPAFCIQPGAYNLGGSYTSYNPTNLSAAQINKIRLISYYGAPNISNSLEYRFATQILIREVVTGKQANVFYSNPSNSYGGPISKVDTSNAEANIMKGVNNHYKDPSFSKSTVTLIEGETISLNDTNGVLADYELLDHKEFAKIVNGKLEISFDKPGEYKINLQKKKKYNTTSLVYWYSSRSQNLLSGSFYDPVYSSLQVKVLDIKSNISLNKTDSETGENVAGAVFELLRWNEEEQDYLPYANVEYNNMESDRQIDGEYIIKHNIEDGKLVTEEILLEDNYYVTQDGQIYLPDVVKGEYALREVISPDGYVINDTLIPFIVNENGATIELQAPNKEITANISISKIDSSTKEILGGAVMKIEKYNFSEDKWEEYGEYTTIDGKELIIEGVEYGSYRLAEVKAPNGYKLSSLNIQFDVTEDNAKIDLVFPNTSTLVRTGLYDPTIVLVISVLTMFAMRKLYLNKIK